MKTIITIATFAFAIVPMNASLLFAQVANSTTISGEGYLAEGWSTRTSGRTGIFRIQTISKPP